MSRPGHILSIAGDAGGAEALAPVLNEWQRRRHTADAFAYGPARSIWRNAAIRWDELGATVDSQKIEGLLCNCAPDMLVVATSCNRFNFERRFAAVAARMGVPTFAILDSWTRYRERFSGPGLKPTWPDWLTANDERMLDELVRAGCPQERIRVTGLPSLDNLADRASKWPSKLRSALRARLNVLPGERLVTFASQPGPGWLADAGIQRADNQYSLGDSLMMLAKALDDLAESHSLPVTLLVRPHPRDDEPQPLPRVHSLRALISKDEDGDEVALSSDLVVGMDSMYLIRASCMGVRTIAIQSRQRGRVVQSGRCIQIVQNPEELSAALSTMLLDSEPPAMEPQAAPTFRGVSATEKVVEWIEWLVRNRSALQ